MYGDRADAARAESAIVVAMNPAAVRAKILEALFADGRLAEMLVLKGGNALEIVHKLAERASVDLDFSMSGDFDDFDLAKECVLDALRRGMAAAGCVVFDETFTAVPFVAGEDRFPWWGGYRVTFKLIPSERADLVGTNRKRAQMQSIALEDGKRTYKIDISKYEWCEGVVRRQMGPVTVAAYTEEMCVVEKFRAICQQMDEYVAPLNSHPTPRARDFYDIETVVSRRALDLSLPEYAELFRSVFAAKHVPLRLLGLIEGTRDFHEQDWPSVVTSSKGVVLDFSYYFDFCVAESRKLEALWEE